MLEGKAGIFGMPQIGELFGGRYLVKRMIGQGGMGVVFAVEDMKLAGRKLALKVAKTAAGTGVYSSEAETLMRLTHPNLPKITDYYPPAGPHSPEALVMEYIDGYSLAEWLLSSQGAMPIRDVVRVGLQLCSALRYLHEQPRPIIHRDLKPSNVMIDAMGIVKLIDFGISRQYKEGQYADTVQLGTAGYAAPERLHGGQSDVRTDVYGLGAVLCSLATGAAARLQSGKGSACPSIGSLPESFPKPFAAFLERMVDPNPRYRFQSMREVEQGLLLWLEGTGLEASPTLLHDGKIVGIQRQRIVVLSLSGGAGATFLTITLAALIARRGITVTAAEYGGLWPEWQELLPAAYQEKSKAYWEGGLDSAKRNGFMNRRKEALPVKWIPAVLDVEAGYEERLEKFERELGGCRNEIQIVDLSGDWDGPEALQFIRCSDHVVVVADPNVYKWQPSRLNKLRLVQGDAAISNQQWHWIANKYTKFSDNSTWLSMLPSPPVAIVPLLPQEKLWSVIWRGGWPTDYAQLDQKLARPLQPFIDIVVQPFRRR